MDRTHAESIEQAPATIEVAALPLGWVTLAPVLCAAHCATAPLLVVIAPALAESAAIEGGLLGLTAIIASLVLPAGMRVHGRVAILMLVLAGLAGWGGSILGLFEPTLPEAGTTIIASLLVASGLFWNARALKKASRCPCPSCEGSTRGS